MGRGDKIDIVRALFLQRKECPYKLFCRDLTAAGRVTDLAILAIDTAQRAPTEEDSPGAPCPGQARLLTLLERRSARVHLCRNSASPGLSRQPIRAASSGAQPTAGIFA